MDLQNEKCVMVIDETCQSSTIIDTGDMALAAGFGFIARRRMRA